MFVLAVATNEFARDMILSWKEKPFPQLKGRRYYRLYMKDTKASPSASTELDIVSIGQVSTKTSNAW